MTDTPIDEVLGKRARTVAADTTLNNMIATARAELKAWLETGQSRSVLFRAPDDAYVNVIYDVLVATHDEAVSQALKPVVRACDDNGNGPKNKQVRAALTPIYDALHELKIKKSGLR